MSERLFQRLRKSLTTAFAVAAGNLVCAAPLTARITKIVVDEKISPAFCKGAACAAYGDAGQYEQIAGRAFGRARSRRSAQQTRSDIALGKTPGRQGPLRRYVSSSPSPLTWPKSSGLMWHDVPDPRPLARRTTPMERGFGDVGLASALAGRQRQHARRTFRHRRTRHDERRRAITSYRCPVAKNSDGSPVTGPVMGRIANRSGPGAQPLIIQTNPLPYMPASLDTSKATLVHTRSRIDGRCRHR